MNRCVLSIALAVALAACGLNGQNNTVRTEVTNTWQIGRQAYDANCAGCHEEGLKGAPKTGDREAWAGRSWRWEAVLFEHAKDGYGRMPAKGGDATLDEATVTKAAEYMLKMTYPETRRD